MQIAKIKTEKHYIESPKVLGRSLPSSGVTSCTLGSSHPANKIGNRA